ncbi:hypothetical protein [Glaciibacter superstes]|uniref:hypothetical protein n=1 Tax=Glaciibacter superstes TaxID=501023 RepID=UPI0003B5D4A2|nr:hypothetical protein [Glaciibacter superstes]
MSDNLARVLRPNWTPPLPDKAAPEQAAPERRHIEIVSTRTQRRARPRIAYAFTAMAGMAVIVVAQLLLSVGISQSAYEISTLQDTQVELGRTAESVSEDLIRVSSPQSLAANAEALGMVSNSIPVYLRLSDGAVLGAPSSAPGSQGGSTGLVPNALLAGTPLVTDVPPVGAQGTGVGGAAETTPPVVSPEEPVQPPPATNGLPSPTTH